MAVWTVCSILSGSLSASALAELTPQPGVLKEVRIDQRLNEQMPLETVFKNENAKTVSIGELLGDKPAVLAFVYYECPMLCTLILNGLLRTLRAMQFTAGNEFDIITISFDPGETPEMAGFKKQVYLEQYGRPEAQEGWHFLTGDEASIRKMTDAAGFHYQLDPESGEYAHASAIMVLTPEGRLARYFYGIEYSAKDLRLTLVEASKNKIGSLVDQVLLFCFHYDPVSGKYSLAILNILRLIGLLTVALILGFIFVSIKTERK